MGNTTSMDNNINQSVQLESFLEGKPTQTQNSNKKI